MAITAIKNTYSLDVETVRALEEMARRWGVSKSAALRRAIRATAEQNLPSSPDALAALDALQRRLALSPAKARAWSRRAKSERRASSRKAEDRSR